jgi:hypothetical protein
MMMMGALAFRSVGAMTRVQVSFCSCRRVGVLSAVKFGSLLLLDIYESTKFLVGGFELFLVIFQCKLSSFLCPSYTSSND